jgi:hypothetical protein
MKSQHSTSFFLIIVSVALIGFYVAGCSGDTEPPATSSTQLQIKSNAVITYDQYQTDPTNESKVQGSDDTIKQKKIQSDSVTIQGRTVLAAFENTHATGAKDTTYFSQDANGDFYVLNFGSEAINAVAEPVINTKVNYGWMLVAKMASASGAQWIGVNNPNVSLGSQYPAATVLDSATMKNDTTIAIGTENVKAKHVFHSLVATTFGARASGTLDAYVSAALGAIVITNIHPAVGSGLLPPGPYPGIYRIMLTHN